MNSYFASAEQQANPFLRGKPIGVCAYLSSRGAIIAASVEAKEYGVKTAMRVPDARVLCPGIVLVENEPAKYRYISRKIFAILAEYSDNVSPYSIDEAFVTLTGWVNDYYEAVQVAQEIKERIGQEVGSWLRCSVGVSFTHWLAKFASEERKPDGLTVVKRASEELVVSRENVDLSHSQVVAMFQKQGVQCLDVETVFEGRPLTHATGIADRLSARLKAVGIHTLGQLQQTSVQRMMTVMGKYGYYLWAHVNGIEIPSWIKQEGYGPKSIGHSYCVPKRGRDVVYLKQVLFTLCEKAGRRLRAKDLVARSIYSGWSYYGPGGEWRRRNVLSRFLRPRIFMMRR